MQISPERPSTKSAETPSSKDWAKGFISGLAQEHLKHPQIRRHDYNGIADLASLRGYGSGRARAEWIKGYSQGYLEATTERNELIATMEQLEAVAKEFGRLVFHVPEKEEVIVLDDMLSGPDYIKQFTSRPQGLMRACRWAVNMDSDEEESAESFGELWADWLKRLYHL